MCVACTDDGGVVIVVDGVDVTADAPRSDGDDAIEHIDAGVTVCDEDAAVDAATAAAATCCCCWWFLTVVTCCDCCGCDWSSKDCSIPVDAATADCCNGVCATLNSLERLGTLP